MNEIEIEKYTKLVNKANMKLDALTFEDKERLYNDYDVAEQQVDSLQKEFRQLAKDVENAILELQVLDFLENGSNNPDIQDVEY